MNNINNISLIASLNKHNIYFVKDNTISYYLSVPKTATSVNITIEIKNNLDKYDFTKNDTLWVKENVLTYFKEIDNIPYSYAVPMFNSNLLNIMGNTDVNNYIHAEKLITYLINNIYTLLVNNKIQPLKQVILIKNDNFLSFINYFQTRYGNRVVTRTLLELLQENNIDFSNYKKIETEGINFVVGTNSETQNLTVDNNITVEDMTKPTNYKSEPLPASSGGYISYCLLAIASIAFAVFILYLLI